MIKHPHRRLLPMGLNTYSANSTPEADEQLRVMLNFRERPTPKPSSREEDALPQYAGLELRTGHEGGCTSKWYH